MYDSIGFRLNRKSDEIEITPEVYHDIMDKINEVVADFGYKIDVSGDWKWFGDFVIDEREFIKNKRKEYRKWLKEK